MRKFKIFSVLIVVFGLAIGIYFLFFAAYSSGYRVGTIIKMSKRGIVFKTHEGQLHTGGVTGGAEGELASSIWDFSVEKGNKEVLDRISLAADNQHRVKLHYDEKFYQWAFFGETKYFVYQVDILDSSKQIKTESELDQQPNNENTMF